RHRPVAALCRQPANPGQRRSTVARGRALPPGILPAASAAALAVFHRWLRRWGRRRCRRRGGGPRRGVWRRRGGGPGGGGAGGGGGWRRGWWAGTMKPSRFAGGVSVDREQDRANVWLAES